MDETRPLGYTTLIEPWRISNEGSQVPRAARRSWLWQLLRHPWVIACHPTLPSPPAARRLTVQCLPMLACISAPFFPGSTLSLGNVSRDSIIAGKFLLVRHPGSLIPSISRPHD